MEKSKTNKWSRADVINAFLAVFTFALFLVTSYSVKSSNEDNNTRFNQIQDMISSGKEQFEKQTEPFLQVGEIGNYIIKDGQHPSFTYKIFNLGKFPAKQISVSFNFAIIGESLIDSFLNKPFSYNTRKDKEPRYFISSYAEPKVFTQYHFIVPEGTESQFMNHQVVFFFMGEIEYVNTMNNKKREYKFVVKITEGSNNNIIYVYNINENTDIH